MPATLAWHITVSTPSLQTFVNLLAMHCTADAVFSAQGSLPKLNLQDMGWHSWRTAGPHLGQCDADYDRSLTSRTTPDLAFKETHTPFT